ncbi:hypothetical protein D9756_003837 [Leucocoprinus leucothites]|uniref:Uncharacterized protein n=1 Tax=Leucocoprinus leucothites TaxID=201217 RepID=A0A8H5D9I4_9AGAR|nr:hypothetical protein D9756_003837 [Leucoagaricus leucothites]
MREEAKVERERDRVASRKKDILVGRIVRGTLESDARLKFALWLNRQHPSAPLLAHDPGLGSSTNLASVVADYLEAPPAIAASPPAYFTQTPHASNLICCHLGFFSTAGPVLSADLALLVISTHPALGYLSSQLSYFHRCHIGSKQQRVDLKPILRV